MTKDLTERERERERKMERVEGGCPYVRLSVYAHVSMCGKKVVAAGWTGGVTVCSHSYTRRHKHHPTTHSNLRVKKNTFVTRAKNGLRPAISERACFCRVYTVERKAPIKPCPSARMLCEHCCGRKEVASELPCNIEDLWRWENESQTLLKI